MKQPKKQVSIRLTLDTIKNLETIAKHQQLSQSEIITALIQMYQMGSDLDTLDEWFELLRKS